MEERNLTINLTRTFRLSVTTTPPSPGKLLFNSSQRFSRTGPFFRGVAGGGGVTRVTYGPRPQRVLTRDVPET